MKRKSCYSINEPALTSIITKSRPIGTILLEIQLAYLYLI